MITLMTMKGLVTVGILKVFQGLLARFVHLPVKQTQLQAKRLLLHSMRCPFATALNLHNDRGLVRQTLKDGAV